MDDSKDIELLSCPNHEEITNVHEIGLMIYLCLSQIISQASIAQTIVISEKINETFNLKSQGEISWLTAAYSMTAGTFILTFGKIGDVYGYKNLLMVGWFCFGIFSILCGFSNLIESNIFLSVMRGLQGMTGPAIVMPNTQAIIGFYFPESKKRNLYLAIFAAMAPTGFIIGALFSSMFAMLINWSWTFWVCGIVCLSLFGIGLWIVPNNIGVLSKEKFDYLGSFTGVIGLVLINFALNQGANVGWSFPYVYISFIIGISSMFAFVYIEKIIPYSLIPTELLTITTCFILLCVGAGWSCFGIWLNYTFRWAIQIDQDSFILASVKNIPVVPSGFVSALCTPWILRRLPSSCLLLISTIAFLVSIILMGTRPKNQIYWIQKFISILIMPIALETSYPAAAISLSNQLPKTNQGIASSSVLTSINYSVAIGLGFSGIAEKYITKDKNKNLDTLMFGMRAGFKVGMGLAGLSVLLSLLFMYIQMKKHRC